jgi:hypothetical protein
VPTSAYSAARSAYIRLSFETTADNSFAMAVIRRANSESQRAPWPPDVKNSIWLSHEETRVGKRGVSNRSAREGAERGCRDRGATAGAPMTIPTIGAEFRQLPGRMGRHTSNREGRPSRRPSPVCRFRSGVEKNRDNGNNQLPDAFRLSRAEGWGYG